MEYFIIYINKDVDLKDFEGEKTRENYIISWVIIVMIIKQIRFCLVYPRNENHYYRIASNPKV